MPYDEELSPMVTLRDSLVTTHVLAKDLADHITLGLDNMEAIEDVDKWGEELDDKMIFMNTAMMQLAGALLGEELAQDLFKIVENKFETEGT